jgi:hypothetical protein
MGIIVRSLLPSDLHPLSQAFQAQGRSLPQTLLENWFLLARNGELDLLLAEINAHPVGFARIGWFGMEADDALPEVLDFIVFDPFIGCGAAQALAAEAQRRILERTGEIEENALLAIYSERPVRLPRANFVLDGLFINREGRFVPSRQAMGETHRVLCIRGRSAKAIQP